MTPNQITMLIILIAYMAVVLAVGLYASRRVKGSEDFLLAGRSMGLFVLVGTLCATQLGGGNIIGTSTNGYNQGLSGMSIRRFYRPRHAGAGSAVGKAHA